MRVRVRCTSEASMYMKMTVGYEKKNVQIFTERELKSERNGRVIGV